MYHDYLIIWELNERREKEREKEALSFKMYI